MAFLRHFASFRLPLRLMNIVTSPMTELLRVKWKKGGSIEEANFNREIVIDERERKRVEIFMATINPNDKTLVFCANQTHALMVRDSINQIKQTLIPTIATE